MSEKPVTIVAFYSSEELEIKDVESELFTEISKEPFNFYMFHNRDMHFEKSEIIKKLITEKFMTISPEIEYRNSALYMTKVLPDFNLDFFDSEVDTDYEAYLKKINYRISCIFDTFNIFSSIYRDRDKIFIFPTQIYKKFLDTIEGSGIRYERISKIDSNVRRFDLMYWIGYYSRKDVSRPEEGVLNYRSITSILQII